MIISWPPTHKHEMATCWPREITVAAHGCKNARMLDNIGDASDPHAFSLLAIAEQGIRVGFPEAVTAEAEAAREATAEGREDLSALPFITIDPADARDHDDAVYATPDDDPQNPDGHIVWVAIADVAAYVTPNSEMDYEARKRGNSVYMPDRVVPMLPERLSNDLCSLRENELRPALVVRMRIGADGRKRDHQFHRGLIKVVAGLSYGQAQKAFDGAADEAAQNWDTDVLQPLWRPTGLWHGPAMTANPCASIGPNGALRWTHRAVLPASMCRRCSKRTNLLKR